MLLTVQKSLHFQKVIQILVKKLADLDKKAKMVKGVVFRLIRFMKFHQARSRAHEKMSLSYRTIAGRDSTHAAFFELAGAHQKLEHADRFLIDGLKPVIADLLTFTGKHKVIACCL